MWESLVKAKGFLERGCEKDQDLWVLEDSCLFVCLFQMNDGDQFVFFQFGERDREVQMKVLEGPGLETPTGILALKPKKACLLTQLENKKYIYLYIFSHK